MTQFVPLSCCTCKVDTGTRAYGKKKTDKIHGGRGGGGGGGKDMDVEMYLRNLTKLSPKISRTTGSEVQCLTFASMLKPTKIPVLYNTSLG
jgi:hypothetical protein